MARHEFEHSLVVTDRSPIKAAIPKTSQAQFAQYLSRAVTTGYAVGTAENGCAIQILRDAGASVITCASASLSTDAQVALSVAPIAPAMSPMVGEMAVLAKCV